MAIRSLLLLSIVLTIAFAEHYQKQQNISLGVPFTGNFGPWNLRDTANVTITHTVPIVVCFVPTEFGLPKFDQYAENVCSFFHMQTEAGSISFPLLNLNYTFGVYYAAKDVKKEDNNTSVTVEINAESCPAGEYWANDVCSKGEVLHNWNDTSDMVYTKGETAFFVFMVPVRLSMLNVKLEIHTLEPEHFVVYARYNGVPSAAFHDYVDTNGTITADIPHPGVWVFAVHATEAGSATFSLNGMVCPDGEAGNPCAKVPEAANKPAVVITSAGEYATYYYHFQATVKQGLLVSITTDTPNHTNLPKLFATRDQLPDIEGKNADIKNCNGGYCSVVRSIAHNITAATSVDAVEDWYIAVHTNLTGGNTSFGIWFNTTCVAGCQTDNRGTCNDDGTCDCQIDYTGIDCSISKGLGPHYIVLIIIASLVVASAVIGFVAWAYMRRKRQNYEILT
jgi:hypothetical protein